VDNLGIDARITVAQDFGPTSVYSNFTAAVQLKATGKPVNFDKTSRCGFDLDVPAYDRFRSMRSGELIRRYAHGEVVEYED
jgi:hypothetical protein